jgi:hypothetical protein
LKKSKIVCFYSIFLRECIIIISSTSITKITSNPIIAGLFLRYASEFKAARLLIIPVKMKTIVRVILYDEEMLITERT